MLPDELGEDEFSTQLQSIQDQVKSIVNQLEALKRSADSKNSKIKNLEAERQQMQHMLNVMMNASPNKHLFNAFLLQPQLAPEQQLLLQQTNATYLHQQHQQSLQSLQEQLLRGHADLYPQQNHEDGISHSGVDLEAGLFGGNGLKRFKSDDAVDESSVPVVRPEPEYRRHSDIALQHLAVSNNEVNMSFPRRSSGADTLSGNAAASHMFISQLMTSRAAERQQSSVISQPPEKSPNYQVPYKFPGIAQVSHEDVKREFAEFSATMTERERHNDDQEYVLLPVEPSEESRMYLSKVLRLFGDRHGGKNIVGKFGLENIVSALECWQRGATIKAAASLYNIGCSTLHNLIRYHMKLKRSIPEHHQRRKNALVTPQVVRSVKSQGRLDELMEPPSPYNDKSASRPHAVSPSSQMQTKLELAAPRSPTQLHSALANALSPVSADEHDSGAPTSGSERSVSSVSSPDEMAAAATAASSSSVLLVSAGEVSKQVSEVALSCRQSAVAGSPEGLYQVPGGEEHIT